MSSSTASSAGGARKITVRRHVRMLASEYRWQDVRVLAIYVVAERELPHVVHDEKGFECAELFRSAVVLTNYKSSDPLPQRVLRRLK